MERLLDIPRACKEICPTGAIQTGSMAKLAKMGRQKVAKWLMHMRNLALTMARIF